MNQKRISAIHDLKNKKMPTEIGRPKKAVQLTVGISDFRELRGLFICFYRPLNSSALGFR